MSAEPVQGGFALSHSRLEAVGHVLTHQGKIEPVPQQCSSCAMTKCQAEDLHPNLRRQGSQQLPQAHDLVVTGSSGLIN